MSDIQNDEIEILVKEVLLCFFLEVRFEIGNNSRLVEDLWVDSIGIVEILMCLNEAFDIELHDAEAAEWRTVADICCSVRVCKGG
jgi:acyl carrier protein